MAIHTFRYNCIANNKQFGNWIHVHNTDPLSNYRPPKICVVEIILVLLFPIKIEDINRFMKYKTHDIYLLNLSFNIHIKCIFKVYFFLVIISKVFYIKILYIIIEYLCINQYV